MNCKHIKECKNADCRNFCGDDNLLGECDNFMRDTSKPLTHSENAPENGDSEKRVDEESLSQSDVKKIATIIFFCRKNIHNCGDACPLVDICITERNEAHNARHCQNWSDSDISTAYELIKNASTENPGAKQPDTPPVTTLGTATSATHYQLLTQQPIEIMQRLMTHEQFIGFLWGNVIKYALRLGHKDDTASDAGKLAQYARWLAQVENGETIRP